MENNRTSGEQLVSDYCEKCGGERSGQCQECGIYGRIETAIDETFGLVNSSNYVDLAIRTESVKDVAGSYSRLLHAALGLCTEAGEFADAIKKGLFYDKLVDRTNLIEEMGDILWYIAVACSALEVDLKDVMRKNIEKLSERYGDKFSDIKAITRDLEAERKILES